MAYRNVIEERYKDAPFLGYEETLHRNVLPRLEKKKLSGFGCTAAVTEYCRLLSTGTLSVNEVTFLLFSL